MLLDDEASSALPYFLLNPVINLSFLVCFKLFSSLDFLTNLFFFFFVAYINNMLWCCALVCLMKRDGLCRVCLAADRKLLVWLAERNNRGEAAFCPFFSFVLRTLSDLISKQSKVKEVCLCSGREYSSA